MYPERQPNETLSYQTGGVMKRALTGRKGALAQAQVTDSGVSPHELLAPQRLTLSCFHVYPSPPLDFHSKQLRGNS